MYISTIGSSRRTIHTVIPSLQYKTKTNPFGAFKNIQCHDIDVIQRETKVYQESRELQEREVLVSLVQRLDSALILTNHKLNRQST